MDPLSRQLNEMHLKFLLQSKYGIHIINHLLFVDDLELLAASNLNRECMVKETLQFLTVVGVKTKMSRYLCNTAADFGFALPAMVCFGLALLHSTNSRKANQKSPIALLNSPKHMPRAYLSGLHPISYGICGD